MRTARQHRAVDIVHVLNDLAVRCAVARDGVLEVAVRGAGGEGDAEALVVGWLAGSVDLGADVLAVVEALAGVVGIGRVDDAVGSAAVAGIVVVAVEVGRGVIVVDVAVVGHVLAVGDEGDLGDRHGAGPGWGHRSRGAGEDGGRDVGCRCRGDVRGGGLGFDVQAGTCRSDDG